MTNNETLVDDAEIELYWLPLGAGDATHCVRTNGRIFEAIAARREHRRPRDIFHSALQVRLGARRWVIEMAPAWAGADRDREVAAVGPVGLAILGRSRWFRYEVRCWRDGRIPDLEYAVDSPWRVTTDSLRVQRLLDLAPQFPTATWGRDELETGDMWNSNSLIAWLLARSGHDAAGLSPPAGGCAPGWQAGLITAQRRRTEVTLERG